MDVFNPDAWKQQWAAFMNYPYIMLPLLTIVAAVVWWFRGWQIKVFEDRLKLADERAAWANEAKDEVVRKFNDLKAEASKAGNSALAARVANVDAAMETLIAVYDSPFTSQWPLAPAVIDYVALSLGISRYDACLALQQRLLDGSIMARGPVKSASATEIDSEFWRFALPDPEGWASNLSTLVHLPWFEVCAKDVLAIWPIDHSAAARKARF